MKTMIKILTKTWKRKLGIAMMAIGVALFVFVYFNMGIVIDDYKNAVEISRNSDGQLEATFEGYVESYDYGDAKADGTAVNDNTEVVAITCYTTKWRMKHEKLTKETIVLPEHTKLVTYVGVEDMMGDGVLYDAGNVEYSGGAVVMQSSAGVLWMIVGILMVAIGFTLLIVRETKDYILEYRQKAA